MNKKLYVGGLNYAVDDTTLKSLFEEAGNVESAKVITDFASGRSKGFGFVEMSSSEEAEKAIQKFNGFNHQGRTITVSEAKPHKPGGAGGRSSHGGKRHSGGFGNRDRHNDSY